MSFSTAQAVAAIVGEQELIEIHLVREPEYYTTGRKPVSLPSSHPLNDTGSTIDFIPAPISRNTVRESHDSAGNTSTQILVPLKTTDFEGILIDGGLGPVRVNIHRGFGDPVASPENYQKNWFQGVLTETQVADRVLVATVKSSEYLLELSVVPGCRHTRTCNHATYSDNGLGEKGVPLPACGLDEADFTYNFTVESVVGGGKEIHLTPDDPTNSGYEIEDADGAPGYFTLGRIWLEAEPEGSYSLITGHTYDSVNDEMVLTLHTPIPQIAATESPPEFTNRVSASWGDDLTYDTCSLKFGNRENFLGHNRMPTINPALVEVFPR